MACATASDTALCQATSHDEDDAGEVARLSIVARSGTRFTEWLIGIVRRECLDRTLFWTAEDLELKLLDFQGYYNGHRTHAGLDGGTPEPSTEPGSARARVSSYRWQPHCRGLYQTPMAA